MYKLKKHSYRPEGTTNWKVLLPLWQMINKTPDPLDEQYILGKTKQEMTVDDTKGIYSKSRILANSLDGYQGFDREWISESHLVTIYYFDNLENCVSALGKLKEIQKTIPIKKTWEIELPNGEVKSFT
jgi:hypothetical protein